MPKIFKLISWNINSINARINHLLSLIEQHNPDVICLQEIKSSKEKFPYEILEQTNYNYAFVGQKAFNGVAILSKSKLDNIKTDFKENPLSSEARFIEVEVSLPIGFSKIISIYVPNGQELNSPKFLQKLLFLEKFFNYCISINNLDENIIITGDFNVAPFDIDHFSNITKICTSLQEKLMIRKFFNIGFKDHFRMINPNSEDFSWWDYRDRSFQKNYGYRIDFILSNTKTLKHLKDSYIDKSFRELDKPSDHAPVLSIWEKI